MNSRDLDTPFDRTSPVFADLESKLGMPDLLAWIDDEALLTARGSIKSTAVEVTASVLARHNVNALFFSLDVPGQAYITEREGGFAIYVNSGLPELARRFTIGHELGHTLFLERGDCSRGRSPLQRHNDPVVEYLCNRFAAGFLLPRAPLERWLYQNGFDPGYPERSVHLLPRVARLFRVAPQAVARRVFYHLAAKRYAIVSLRQRPEKDWVVSWCAVPGDVQQMAADLRFALPFRSGRVIPQEYVPVTASTFASDRTSLHGLWWRGVTPKSPRETRKPMKQWPYAQRRTAWVSRINGRMYVAMPLSEGESGSPTPVA
ncbi:MAG TPA: ImmA/IrrE family metallo-endopeptidase [Thermoanaerobaculia bacterium]|jgi:Zn-dependent peptidase ImmA (M78 family)|nr:ImmA/IrrE family metallo-endopeptidase [Thermoanaerobaculia bacterium]